MNSRVIRQGVSEDSLFNVIKEWCDIGAGRRDCRLRFMSAFASQAGVAAILPLFDIFLSDGNEIDVIVGIDRDGTDRGALQHLEALRHAYPGQVSVRVFQAPSRTSIFHPKLYIFNTARARSIVIGSGNLTSGGLGDNFESLIYHRDCAPRDRVSLLADEIWDLFSDPQPPLRTDFLRPLTPSYLSRLIAKLPVRAESEDRSVGDTFKSLWKSLSRVPLPRSSAPTPRGGRPPSISPQSYLLMDILTETRVTQMQVPLSVVEGFFGVERSRAADLQVSIYTKTGLSQPIERPLVISQGREGRRLMRRLEMPQIRNLQRPLAVIFLKIRRRRQFAFKLLPRSSPAYRAADRLLAREGQQGSAERRYIIARRRDTVWRAVSRLLSI